MGGDFGQSDRADRRKYPVSCSGGKWTYRTGDGDRLRFMARSGNYVMARKTRCMPFVLTVKEWEALPPFLEVSKLPTALKPPADKVER